MNIHLGASPRLAIRASAWTLATGAFALAVVVLLACYWRTAWSLIGIWTHDGTYQYGFLIFPIGVWLAFGLRHQVRANAPAPSIWGLAAIVMLVALWYVGRILDINLPQHFAFVTLFPALVLTCWGWRALWTLKFPLAYLVVFAVPWGDSMVGPLQDITARFAVHALSITGTPVLLNGREIITPSAVWMVAEACSGVKFFIACTALGCLFAYVMYARGWKRVVFALVSTIAPIIANGLRVYFTILIGETFGVKYAHGTDHMIFGWQFFGTVLIVLFLVGWFFRDRLVAVETPSAFDGPPLGGRVAVWPAVLALLIVGPVLAAQLATGAPPSERLQISAPTLAGWSGPEPAPDGWRPSFAGATGSFKAAYRSNSGADTVQLFHAVYLGKPRRGHDLITYGNDVYDAPAQVQILESTTRRVDLAGGSRVTARELRLAEAQGTRLVWYWYCVDHRCTASPVLVKLLQAWDVLRGDAPRSSVWALSLSVANSNMAKARQALQEFAQQVPLAEARGPSVAGAHVAEGGSP